MGLRVSPPLALFWIPDLQSWLVHSITTCIRSSDRYTSSNIFQIRIALDLRIICTHRPARVSHPQLW